MKLIVSILLILLSTCSAAHAKRGVHQLYDDIHNTYTPHPKNNTNDTSKNNGHGNNVDGVDSSNPGKSKSEDSSGTVDDEKTK